MNLTPYDLALRYVGVKELAGSADHPLIRWWLSLCFDGHLDLPDETPWCSAFVNGIAWELRLPRSKSAAARSWLGVGKPIDRPEIGSDLVILNRGGVQDPTVAGPGHVGFFAGLSDAGVMILGGNQGDQVKIAHFDPATVLGFRRIE